MHWCSQQGKDSSVLPQWHSMAQLTAHGWQGPGWQLEVQGCVQDRGLSHGLLHTSHTSAAAAAADRADLAAPAACTA